MRQPARFILPVAISYEEKTSAALPELLAKLGPLSHIRPANGLCFRLDAGNQWQAKIAVTLLRHPRNVMRSVASPSLIKWRNLATLLPVAGREESVS